MGMNITRTILRPLAFVAGLHVGRQVRSFLAAHGDTAGVQDRLLAELIRHHADTAFGRDHGFAGIRTYDDFRSAVAVGSYEALRPYVRRVLEGDTTALLPPDDPRRLETLHRAATHRG